MCKANGPKNFTRENIGAYVGKKDEKIKLKS
jgi:hypothetical protein